MSLKTLFPSNLQNKKLRENNQAKLWKKLVTFQSNAAYVRYNMVYLHLGACIHMCGY